MVLILKHGDTSKKGRSLVCYYNKDDTERYRGKWVTLKKWITDPMQEVTLSP